MFCRTRTEVDELTETLNGRGYRAEALHGGLSQEQRDRVMKRFRANTTDLLIATDVAARGLDIQHVSHVVNYDVPSAAEAYVHRIGRTGRAGREGVAITLAEPREHRLLRNIEQLTKQQHRDRDRADGGRSARAPARANTRRAPRDDSGGRSRCLSRGRRVAGGRSSTRWTSPRPRSSRVEGAMVSVAEEEIPIAPVAGCGARRAHDARRESPPPGMRRRRKDRPSRGGQGSERSVAWRGLVARLYIGAGRKAKVRPGDLVGAIANEAGIDAGDIGAVRITDRFSLVEVPEEIADDVIAALSGDDDQGEARAGEAGSGRALERLHVSGRPTLPSTTAALRFNPAQLRALHRRPLNAALNSSCVIASSSRASVRASLPAIASRAANGLPAGSARENFSFHGHTSWQMSQP